MQLLALLFSTPALAACPVVVDVRVRRSGRRQDQLAFSVPDDDAPSCHVLPLDVAGRMPEGVAVQIRRGDGRSSTAGRERVSVRWDGGAFVPELHLPELRGGEAVTVTLDWADPAGFWAPPGGRAPEWLRIRSPRFPDARRAGVTDQTAALPLNGDLPLGPAVRGVVPSGGSLGLKLDVDLSPGTRWSVQEPPEGQARWTWTRSLRPGEQVAVPWPPGGRDLECAGDGAVSTADGCVVTAGTRPIDARWAWTLDRVPVAGSISTAELGPSPQPPALHVEINGDGLELVLQTEGSPAQRGTGRVSAALEEAPPVGMPLQPTDELTRLPPQRIAWRIAGAQGRGVLNTRDDLLQLVAWHGLHASIPEPGLPNQFKGRRDDPAIVDEVFAWLQAEVDLAPDGVLRDGLLPRPLVDVRRSGIGTPWELSLLLARYLGQLKLDATPIPVRTAAASRGGATGEGAWDLAMPIAYDDAVVMLVGSDGNARWLSPGCADCGTRAPPAGLGGGTALSASLLRLPSSEPSEAHMSVAWGPEGDGTATLRLVGDPARALRRQLLDLDAGERGPWLAQHLQGTQLVSHVGLREPGQPVELVVAGVQPTPAIGALPIPFAEGQRLGWTWSGPWSLRQSWPLDGAPPSPCQLTATVGGDRIQVAQGSGEGRYWVEEVLQRGTVLGPGQLPALHEARDAMRAACAVPGGEAPQSVR